MIGVTLGRAIRARRLELNLTQAALAERAHVTPKYIAKLEAADENNDVNPTLLTIQAIADGLETKAARLLEEPTARPERKKASAKVLHKQLASMIRRMRAEHVLALITIVNLITSKPDGNGK